MAEEEEPEEEEEEELCSPAPPPRLEAAAREPSAAETQQSISLSIISKLSRGQFTLITIINTIIICIFHSIMVSLIA